MKFYHNNIRVSILSCLLPVLLLLPLMLFPGCSGSYRDDPRLRNIGTKLSDRSLPSSEALPLLDSLEKIPDTDLSEGERHYRDFLTIKASDKGYVKHTSDSLYLTVKDYFSSHYSREMLPEVLYYGGRVYSDMGSYPVALQYFQEALDCMGDNPENLHLKPRVLSQTGRLLSKLSVNDEALKYVVECLKMYASSTDTLNYIYNLELAAAIASRLKDYPKAQVYLEKACSLSRGKYPSEYAINRFRLGKVAYEEGNMQDALTIIRETMNEVDSTRRNYVLPVAAQVYLKAGMADTAYIYARELISNTDTLNRGIGYYVLLSDSLRRMSPSDTLSEYFRRYNEWLEGKRNDNMEHAAIMQHSLYNYNLHDKARHRAEKERNRLMGWLIFTGFSLALVIMGILIFMLRRERRFNKLYSKVAKISIFNRLFPFLHLQNGEQDNLDGSAVADDTKESDIPGKESLMDSLEKLESNELQIRFIEEFHRSSLYLDIIACIEENRSMEGDKQFWGRIEDFFTRFSPNFLPQLLVLTDGRLSKPERQTAMLIKCEIRTGHIALLLAKSKGTIVSRRDAISLKIYGVKKGSKFIDNLIRLL